MKATHGLAFALILFLSPATRAEGGASVVTAPVASPAGAAVNQPGPAWPSSSTPAARTVERGVQNFGRLNAAVWRAGQPTRDGYKRLAALGLKTVVNLRAEFPRDSELIPPGMRYVYIPIKDRHAPTETQARELLRVVSNSENWPVLIHCQAGQGRTGTMCAVLRHSLDSWDDAKVMKEVDNFRVMVFSLVRIPMARRQIRFIRRWEETTESGKSQHR